MCYRFFGRDQKTLGPRRPAAAAGRARGETRFTNGSCGQRKLRYESIVPKGTT